MSDIWLVSSGMQEGPVRDRATAGFGVRNLQTMCLEAAVAALDKVPGISDVIDGVYFGTMGVMQSDATDRLHPRHIPSWLAHHLELPTVNGPESADAHVTVLGTSDAGAQVFHRAVRDLALGLKKTVLVVAGEQMLTADRPGLDLKTRRRQDAKEYQDAIQTVVDPEESGPYGLTMLSIGDLLMSHIQWRSGIPAETWQDWIATVTLRKHDSARYFPKAMQTGRDMAGGVQAGRTQQNYFAERTYGDWFRADDVGSPANGATAVVLTTDMDWMKRRTNDDPTAPWLKVLATGHGETHPALLHRPGPLHRSPSIRKALTHVCRAANLSPRVLGNTDLLFGVLHDAFPSIELLFLTEIAAAAYPEWDEETQQQWVKTEWLRGNYNPFGGLCANGHALGNTGLYQIAQTADVILSKGGDPQQSLDHPLVLITSVGSALTNIVATLLVVTGPPQSPLEKKAQETLSQWPWQREDNPKPETPHPEGALPLDHPTIVARTTWVRSAEIPRVYLVQTQEAVNLAIDEHPEKPGYNPGQRVEQVNEAGVWKARAADGEDPTKTHE